MTLKAFWKEIEARTSKEVADFGFDGINEEDLPGVTFDNREGDTFGWNCADLDAAAVAAKQAYDAFRETDAEKAFDRFFSR